MCEACVVVWCFGLCIGNLADIDFVDSAILKMPHNFLPILIGIVEGDGTSLIWHEASGIG